MCDFNLNGMEKGNAFTKATESSKKRKERVKRVGLKVNADAKAKRSLFFPSPTLISAPPTA